MMRWRMSGGRFDGCSLAVAAPYTPTRIWLVPSPDDQLDVLLVGTDRMAPGPMFTDAAEYELDRTASSLRDHPEYEGMEVGDALYVAV